MHRSLKKYWRPDRILILVSLLIFLNDAYSQQYSDSDTTIKISRGSFIQIGDSVSFFSGDTILKLPSSLTPVSNQEMEKNFIFFDSLKAKASKNPLTKKLYDLVIIAPDSVNIKELAGASDARYLNFSGKKIRNITIQRLDVFGTNINNPASEGMKKVENILNKTHANTTEKIIRNNLLFREGDTISPLTLSDNERILRQLSYIDDARIIIIPVSEDEADIMVLTKDVYSLGGTFNFKGINKGSVSLFDKNIFGMGHELGVEMPFDADSSGSPGFGAHYLIDNIYKSFINLNIFYFNGLGRKNYGFILSRNLISATSKYAGGISVRRMYTTEDLDTLPSPEPLKYNLQDYWFERSFLIDKDAVSRIIFGVRYKNNNVFERPFILPDSYYHYQDYRIFLGSAAFSLQKYYKANLIYNYGRTEDIPYGGLFKLTMGRERNEFRNRTYLGAEIAIGQSTKSIGYFYGSVASGSFLSGTKTEQGILSLKMNYVSNIVSLGNHMNRNFIYLDYTRGFDRNTDEYLFFNRENGFSGFKNDSINGKQRLSMSFESVLFSPLNLYGFRFAFFGFTDLAFLSGTNEVIRNGYSLASIGMGLRIRNDNMVFNTFQLRIGFFPNPPIYSVINNFVLSGEQLLSPNNFDTGPPSIISYR
jgi:hypothetical protein